MVQVVSPGNTFPVEARTRGNVHFTSDYRLDSLPYCLIVELDDTHHGAVIGHGNAGHSQLLYPGNEITDLDQPIEQAVLRVQMQMDKVHLETPYTVITLTPCRLFLAVCNPLLLPLYG